MLFVAGDLITLRTIQSLARRWLKNYHQLKVPGWEERSNDPKVGNFDPYAADVEGKGY